MKAYRIGIMILMAMSLAFPLAGHTAKKKYQSSPMPSSISPPGEKVIIVNPNIHKWGAYSANGQLVRSGMATAGNTYCPDIRRGCKTKSGTFRINSLGSRGCKSSRYPRPHGGAPMPYCMFFNGNQGLHGSYNVVAANVSHGCVRLKVDDAYWLRFNFVDGPNAGNGYRGTKVVVKPY